MSRIVYTVLGILCLCLSFWGAFTTYQVVQNRQANIIFLREQIALGGQPPTIDTEEIRIIGERLAILEAYLSLGVFVLMAILALLFLGPTLDWKRWRE